MKFTIFLALAIAAATSLPLQDQSPYSPDVTADSYSREGLGEANSQDIELAKADGKISIIIKGKNGTWRREIRFHENSEEDEGEIDLADLPPVEPAKFRIRIRGKIKIGIKFSNPIAPVETDLQSAQGDKGLIRIRAEDDSKEDVHVGGSVELDEEGLNKLVEEELAKLGIKIKNRVNVIQIVEPVEMEDIEILPPAELEGKEINLSELPQAELAKFRIKIKGKIHIRIKFSNPIAMQEARSQLTQDIKALPISEQKEIDLADLPKAELAKFRIRIRGKIKIGIKFSNPIAMAEAESNLEQEKGSVNTHVEGSDNAKSIHVGGTVKIEELNEVEIEDVEIVSTSS